MEASSVLTDRQEMAAALVPVFPAVLSLLGSVLLIRLTTKMNLEAPHHRILFAMSCFDIINTVNIVLQSFLVPRETSRRLWAVGNNRTCFALGFVFQMSYSSFMYFGVLTLYFMLSIRLSVSDRFFATRIEPCLHAFVLLFPVTTAIYAGTRNLYGEVAIGAGCWLHETPTCDKDCISGLEWLLGGLPFVSVFVMVLLNNAIIVFHVRGTLRRTARRSMRPVESQEARLAEVASQCTLYVIVFILTYAWTIVLRLMSNNDAGPEQEDDLFAVMMLRAIFLPSMGFGNLMVYVRPRYIQCRKFELDKTRWWAFRRVVWDCNVGQQRRASDLLVRDGRTCAGRRASDAGVRPLRQSQILGTSRFAGGLYNSRDYWFSSFLRPAESRCDPLSPLAATVAAEEKGCDEQPLPTENADESGVVVVQHEDGENDECQESAQEQDKSESIDQDLPDAEMERSR